jgi:hypothetical protein
MRVAVCVCVCPDNASRYGLSLSLSSSSRFREFVFVFPLFRSTDVHLFILLLVFVIVVVSEFRVEAYAASHQRCNAAQTAARGREGGGALGKEKHLRDDVLWVFLRVGGGRRGGGEWPSRLQTRHPTYRDGPCSLPFLPPHRRNIHAARGGNGRGEGGGAYSDGLHCATLSRPPTTTTSE